MDIRKIKKLIELLEETGISEIEIKEGEESLRLSRHHSSDSHMRHAASSSHQIHHIAAHTTPAPIAVQHAAPAAAPTTPAPVIAAGHQVLSPMVGTAYLASSPESAPFVTIGKSVQIGETLCIIEAMKMFNEVEADRSGTIKAILIKNGDPVEYDEPLFIIE
jgi:acetyl-CoA carboxylase biotin carboxyl carrier protein